MADLYKCATVGVGQQWRFPDDGNGDLWEFRPGEMGLIDVFLHRPDGTVVKWESILADIRTLQGEKTS